MIVKLSFVTFFLENHPTCAYDWVEVSKKKYCGSIKPDPIISSETQMTVTFNSDGSEKRDGFIAYWTFIEK